MRRFTVGLAIVFALSLLLAAVAVAAPPDFCDEESPKYNPYHPSCSDTTTTTVPSAVPLCDDIPLLGGPGRTSFQCVWTPEQPEDVAEDLEGNVTVNVVGGEASQLVVLVRDSAPGDICVLMQEWPDQPGPVFTATFPLADGARDSNYWDFGGTSWCEPYDSESVAGQREDLNGKPLHVNVGFVGKKNTVVEVTLFPVEEGTS